jgi:hypothetical protein
MLQEIEQCGFRSRNLMLPTTAGESIVKEKTIKNSTGSVLKQKDTM